MKSIRMKIPEGCNIILGQTHFLKTVEDLFEVMVTAVPEIKFGLAFCESSGECLVRSEGTDKELQKIAEKNALELSTGHAFLIILGKGFYPINVLNAIKSVPEVCNIFCATANPVEVVIAESEQGRGILGVIDGLKSKGIEKPEDVKKRKEFLRQIGYKL
ncbi:MAG: adenosine-specific kinase [Candidatus Micrarchaeota archaeon]|nr:adenosine-specific kinase [Candidatus Micrarchaeota archaeon]